MKSGQGQVGLSINVRHLAPTPVGKKVRAEAELVAIDRRKLTFKVRAFDEMEQIGDVEHERFTINPAVRSRLPYDARKDFAGVARLASTPKEAVNGLSTEILRALQLPGVKDVITKVGLNLAALAAGEFDAFLRAELQRNEKIAREVGLKID